MNVSMCAITLHLHLRTGGGIEGTSDVEDPHGVGDTIGVELKRAGRAGGSGRVVGSRRKHQADQVTSEVNYSIARCRRYCWRVRIRTAWLL
jgi:hypothetical protein